MQDQVSDIHISEWSSFTNPKALLPILLCSCSVLDVPLSRNPKVSKKSICLFICRFGCIFFLFSLGSCWNLMFYCKLSRLQQQQLWRIWQWLSVTNQRELGPEPQWKSSAWQACFLGIVLQDPKWTKSERFDLLGLKSGREFFCSVLSLQMHQLGGPWAVQDWVKNPASRKTNGKNKCFSSACHGPSLSKPKTQRSPSLLLQDYPSLPTHLMSS